MAKRLRVRYIGNMYSRCTPLGKVPEGTEFKAVESLDAKGRMIGVLIRGSSLTTAYAQAIPPKSKATKHKFKAKQYLFLIGADTANSMEIIN